MRLTFIFDKYTQFLPKKNYENGFVKKSDYPELISKVSIADVGWRSFGEGQLQSVLLDGNDSSSSTPSSSASQMNAVLYGLCLTGFILIAIIVFILIYKLIKQSKNKEEKVRSNCPFNTDQAVSLGYQRNNTNSGCVLHFLQNLQYSSIPIPNEYGGDTDEVEACGADDVADEVGCVADVEGDRTVP